MIKMPEIYAFADLLSDGISIRVYDASNNRCLIDGTLDPNNLDDLIHDLQSIQMELDNGDAQ